MRISQPFQSKNKLPKEPVPFIYFLGLLETPEWIINLLEGGNFLGKKSFMALDSAVGPVPSGGKGLHVSTTLSLL